MFYDALAGQKTLQGIVLPARSTYLLNITVGGWVGHALESLAGAATAA